MVRHLSPRSLLLVSAVLTSALLIAPPSDAQKKKKKRKKPAPTTAAPTSAPTPAPAAEAPAEQAEPVESKSADKSPEKVATEEEPTKAAEPSSSETKTHHPMFDLGVGLRGFGRHLSYKNDVDHRLQTYDLSATPSVRVTAGVFPLQGSNFSVGLTGSFEYAFALGSTYKTPGTGQEGKFKTSSMQYAIGARGNYFFGAHSITLGVDYGAQTFDADLPPPAGDVGSVPDVNYSFVRPNLMARLGLADKFSAQLEVGYLVVLKSGEILSSNYFPNDRAKVSGFDVGLGANYEIATSVDLRLYLDYRRYSFKFSPINDGKSPFFADGATDDYLGLSLMAAYSK